MDLAGNAEERRGCCPENYKPCNLASAPLRLGHGLRPYTAPCNLAGKACSVTGCRPIKKLKNKFSYVSELPTKFVFTFFAWLVVFVKKVLALWKKVW